MSLTYIHWFEDCPDHENCIRHVGEGQNEVGEFRTESHMSSLVDPSFRLNLDYPDADDRRQGAATIDRVLWALADDAAIALDEFPWDERERRRVAAVAAVKGLGLVTELAAIAKVDAVELVAEARAQKWVDVDEKAVLDAQIAIGEIALPVDVPTGPVDPKGGARA